LTSFIILLLHSSLSKILSASLNPLNLAPKRFPKKRFSVASPAKRSLGSTVLGIGRAKSSISPSDIEVV
jgi:hypothetical protein